jgi:hypothetical protein
MSQGPTFSASAGDGAAASRLEKQRDALFAQSDQVKRKLAEETASYRLKSEGDRFSSSSNAAEVALSQATVGLVSKEEFARRRAALEGNAALSAKDGPAPPPAAKEESKTRRKKKKGGGSGALSFAFDEEEEEQEEGSAGGGGRGAFPKRQKSKADATAQGAPDAQLATTMAPSAAAAAERAVGVAATTASAPGGSPNAAAAT